MRIDAASAPNSAVNQVPEGIVSHIIINIMRSVFNGSDIFDQSWDGESQMMRTIVCDLGATEGLVRSTGNDYIFQSSFEKSLLLGEFLSSRDRFKNRGATTNG